MRKERRGGVLDRRSSNRPAALVTEVADVLYVLRLEPDRELEYISPAIEAMTGHAPHEHYEDPDPVCGLVDPRDREGLRATHRAALGVTSSCDVRWLTRDGREVWAEHRCRRMRRADGSVVVYGSARDVTTERRDHEALLDSEEEFRLLAANATDLVVRTTPDQRITWISPTVARTLGWTPPELIGVTLVDLVHASDRAAWSEQQTDDRIADARGGCVVRFRSKSGQYRWMSGAATPVVDDDGDPDGVVTGLRLVDDLVHARQAAESDRARLRSTLDSLLDPHVLLRAVRDTTGRITDFAFVDGNLAACDHMRMTFARLTETTLLRVLPGARASGLFTQLCVTVNRDEPISLDDVRYDPDDALGPGGWLDLRGARFEDGLSLTWRDVTARHRGIEALAASEEHYRLLAENASDVVVRVHNGTIVWVSPSISEAIGWTSDDWTGHAVQEFVHADDLERIRREHDHMTAHDRRVTRFRILAKDGSYHWVEAHTRLYLDASGVESGHVAAARLVDAEVAAEGELERRATHDELTGLLNRSEAFRRLEERANYRRRGEASAVLFIDLDGLKAVNDAHGHTAGDTLLRAFAQRIRGCVRNGDLVARVGGDEFLIVLDAVADLDEAVALGEKVRLRGGEPVTFDGTSLSSTSSVGVTLAAAGESAGSAIARADGAMYQAKKSGGNCVAAVPVIPDAG